MNWYDDQCRVISVVKISARVKPSPVVPAACLTRNWPHSLLVLTTPTTNPHKPSPGLSFARSSRPDGPWEFNRSSTAYHKTKPNARVPPPFPQVSVKASGEIKSRISKQYTFPQIINKISKAGGGEVGEESKASGPWSTKLQLPADSQ